MITPKIVKIEGVNTPPNVPRPVTSSFDGSVAALGESEVIGLYKGVKSVFAPVGFCRINGEPCTVSLAIAVALYSLEGFAQFALGTLATLALELAVSSPFLMSNSTVPSTTGPTSSQWQRLLKNAGTWKGSFAKISPLGELISQVRTEVELTPSDDGKAMHQEVRRYPENAEPKIQTLDYRSLNRATLFFENGAFSQGSTQWGPFSTFGAELGLISGSRRLRLVQLFDRDELKPFTLIREHLRGTDDVERSPLVLTDLIGTWQGESITQYADLRPETQATTQLTVEQINPFQLRQTLNLGAGSPPISSLGQIDGARVVFDSGAQAVQVLLLPAGASATCPVQINPRQPIFLEVGWLLNGTTRQRLIRRYDAAGAWVSLTLVCEQKKG